MNRIFKSLTIIFIVVLLIIYAYNLSNKNIEYSNEEFIVDILKDNNHYIKYENKDSLINKSIKLLFNIDLKKPKTVLESFFNYKESNNYEKVITKYIEDPIKEEINNPVIYIYNTHQLENYKQISDNITPNVQMASYLLKNLLNKEGIKTIVEEANINDFLSLNGWSYSYSYKASRYYLEDTINKNPDLKLIIDLHRDSIDKDKSTTIIDNKSYAKILFVIGTKYESYEKNYSVAYKLNEIIKNKYPNITRGIIKKGGSNVNGVYNQDLNSNIILIECGGNNNDITEVLNTILVLKDAIKEYLED